MNRSSVRFAGALSLALALAGATVGAQPARPSTAATPVDATRHAAAQQRFERGLGLFDHNDFATALTEFRASLELFSSPNVRLYVGLCLLRTGHLAEAHAELQRTFNEARDLAVTDPNYVDARDAAQQEITRLQPRLGRVVVRMPTPVPGVTIMANETEILAAMTGIPLSFDPGPTTVTARAPGYLEFRQTVQLLANTTTEVSITLRRDPSAAARPVTAPVTTVATAPSGEPMALVPHTALTVTTGGGARVAGFVVGALGLAAVGAFAVLGNMAGTRYDEVVAACRGRCRDNSHDDAIREGETYELLANVSLGAGIGLSLLGVVMIAVGGPRVVEEGRTARSPVRPWFDASRGMVGVGGAF